MEGVNKLLSYLQNLPQKALNEVRLTVAAKTRVGLMAVSGLSLFMVCMEQYKKQEVQKLIALKKERLSMPVYELKGEELVNFPWNYGNLDEWLYRPVKVKGRQIHRNAMRFPVRYGEQPGFHYCVPLCTEEPEDRHPDQRNGVLLNQGWAHMNEYYGERHIHEYDADKEFEYVAYVSVGEDHKKFFGQWPNVNCDQKKSINNFYLPEMAKASEFLNKDQVKVAVLERIDMVGPLDEKAPRHYAGADLSHELEYPYAKTRAGALQCGNMPWDHTSNQKYWSTSALVSGFVALVAKVH